MNLVSFTVSILITNIKIHLPFSSEASVCNINTICSSKDHSAVHHAKESYRLISFLIEKLLHN